MKKWTILIYANGNNEFEPEMYKSFLDVQKIPLKKNINLVFQIGRAEKDLVKILRPDESFYKEDDDWTGVRRYVINEEGVPLFLSDLGFTNMADPKVLYDFILWGMEQFPAEKTVLVLGGHSIEYMGIMTDFSQEMPYIMGIPELCKALNLVSKQKEKKIDILVLDTCYMNKVEILYELVREKKHTVKNVLTYIDYGPIKGIPVDKLCKIIRNNISLKDSDKLIEKIIDDLNLDLVYYKLNRNTLEKIKRASNDIAKQAIKNNMNIEQILNIQDKEIENFKKIMYSLISYYKRINNNNSPLIEIANKRSSNKLVKYYFRLSFLKNNYWGLLLGGNNKNFNHNVSLKPTVLPLQGLFSLISVMNPNADEKKLESIFKKLLDYKNWDQFTNYRFN